VSYKVVSEFLKDAATAFSDEIILIQTLRAICTNVNPGSTSIGSSKLLIKSE